MSLSPQALLRRLEGAASSLPRSTLLALVLGDNAEHCHAVIRPFQGYALEDLLGALKGVTARLVNVVLGRGGALWEGESYDRIVRDEEHLWRVIQYIGRNPRLAGLETEAAWRSWVHPEWEAAGWGFRDEGSRSR